MLNRAGNTHGDVDFGRDDLAGLADLIVVGDVSRVNRRTAGSDARAQLVCQRCDNILERLAVLQRAAVPTR